MPHVIQRPAAVRRGTPCCRLLPFFAHGIPFSWIPLLPACAARYGPSPKGKEDDSLPIVAAFRDCVAILAALVARGVGMGRGGWRVASGCRQRARSIAVFAAFSLCAPDRVRKQGV